MPRETGGFTLSKGIESCDFGKSVNNAEDVSDEDDSSFGYKGENSVGIDLSLVIETISGNI